MGSMDEWYDSRQLQYLPENMEMDFIIHRTHGGKYTLESGLKGSV
jgi:hypothetical protein